MPLHPHWDATRWVNTDYYVSARVLSATPRLLQLFWADLADLYFSLPSVKFGDPTLNVFMYFIKIVDLKNDQW